MVSRDFQTLSRRRSDRARRLAERYEASREVFQFLAGVFDWQAQATPGGPYQSLFELAAETGPEALRAAARNLDDQRLRERADAYLAGADQDSPEAFFARCVLQLELSERETPTASPTSTLCPRCGEPPQGGCLRPLAHGAELWLFCSLCLAEWTFPRGRCASCGETSQLRFHTAEQIPHIQTMTCEACRTYMHLVDLSKDAAAVADVDELSALPLDVWALEQGYSKLRPNLAGI